MRQILLENAYEAWASAIAYCKLLLDGKSTLLNKKFFVSSLHNAVELFIKQDMLNTNNHSVAELRKPKNLQNAKLLVTYYESTDLNSFFGNLTAKEIMLFRTAEFHLLKMNYNKKDYQSDLNLLKDLRNNETHFYIQEFDFLSDNEFVQLHNFMVDFYGYLKENCFITHWEQPYGEYERFVFERPKLTCFSYAEALYANPLSQRLLNVFDESEDYGHIEPSFDLAKAVIEKNENLSCNDFNDVWITLDLMFKCGILECEEIIEENSWHYKYHISRD